MPERLNSLPVNGTAVIIEIDTENAMAERLLDLGFTRGTSVQCVLRQRKGEIAAYQLRNTVIALRKEDAAKIHIQIPQQTCYEK